MKKVVEELTSQTYSNLTTEEYIGFIEYTVEPTTGSYQVDWREASRNVCIEEDLHGPTEAVKEDSDGGDDDESMMEEIPDFRISPREALVFPGKIMCRIDIDAEDSESIVKYR